jgi:SHS2 domain-containing protein
VYFWVEHTAELELAISAPTKEGVFEEALRAFAELIDRDPGGNPVEHAVSATAADAPALLAEWLGELVFLAETQEFVPERVTALELQEHDLHALIAGRADEPSHFVKSVTYHDLELRMNGEAWVARVVLDV